MTARQSRRGSEVKQSGDRAGHFIVPNRDPPDILNNPSSVRSHISSIRMKSLPIAAAYGRTYGLRVLIPISKTSYGSSRTHAGQCGHRARSLPKPGFHHLYNGVFSTVLIDGI
ncbi:hypothetical protein TNCV_1719901 [Trichonephila clavipes]|nr:hypothetical protein TNCV_1719901 [Trichonephila clavipes]